MGTCDAARQEATKAEERLASVQEQVFQLRKQVSSLSEDLEESAAKLSVAQESLSQSRTQNQDLNVRLRVAQKTVDDLQKALDNANAELQRREEDDGEPSRKRQRGLNAQIGEQVFAEELANYDSVAKYRRLLFERLEDLGKAVESFNRIVAANYQEPGVQQALEEFNNALQTFFINDDDRPLKAAEIRLRSLIVKDQTDPTNQLIIKRINMIR